MALTRGLLVVFAASVLHACPAPAAPPAAATATFRAFLEQDWQRRLAESPELATWVGERQHADRWTDWSPAAVARRDAATREALARLDAVAPGSLDAADQLSHALYRYLLAQEVEGQRFPDELLLLDQMRGVHKYIGYTFTRMPRERRDDYAAMIARLRALPRLLEQVRALLESGRAKGITAVRVPLQGVAAQIALLAPEDPAQSALLEAFGEMPQRIPGAQREALALEARQVYRELARPAILAFSAYVSETYLPAARASVGWRELPDGEAWYAYLVRVETTTDLSPQQIHALGLEEVARLTDRLEALRQEAGFAGDLTAFRRHLRDDPRYRFETRAQVLRAYRAAAKRADGGLARLFRRLPQLPYGVEPMPAHIEQNETMARYYQGDLATGQSANVQVNTAMPEQRHTWDVEAIILHEGVPGHHLQIALAQEAGELPAFRRNGSFNAYSEGWALYAETLGRALGMYESPEARFGHLNAQLWRAARLVVDTGLHHMGWSRDQAIAYLEQHLSMGRQEIEVEVDRYIVWPGQALSYMVGKLTIDRLRARAEAALGERFDLRSFHDVLLRDGAMPLQVLEQQVARWLQQAG